MNVQEILLKYVAKQHGISEDAAAELLFTKSEDEDGQMTVKEDALSVLTAKDKERVTALKTAVDKTKIYDKAYADAKTKVLEKAEKALGEKYGVDVTGLKLEQVVEAIVTASADGTDGEGKLDEATVKKHPLYLALEREKTEELNSLKAAHEEEVTGIKANYARTETLTDVKAKVLDIFDGLRPVLPKDATKAANQRNTFAERFATYGYEKQADGSYLILDGDGKRVEDGHGNPIGLDKLVQQDASKLYEFAAQDQKGGAGNENGGGKVTVPTSEAAYHDAIVNATSMEERQAITEAYGAANPD